MGDPIVSILFVAVHADQVHLDPARCMWLNLHLYHLIINSLRQSLSGILICFGGLGMLVASDQLADKDHEAVNKVEGDLFTFAGATLYGFGSCDPLGPFGHHADIRVISKRR